MGRGKVDFCDFFLGDVETVVEFTEERDGSVVDTIEFS